MRKSPGHRRGPTEQHWSEHPVFFTRFFWSDLRCKSKPATVGVRLVREERTQSASGPRCRDRGQAWLPQEQSPCRSDLHGPSPTRLRRTDRKIDRTQYWAVRKGV